MLELFREVCDQFQSNSQYERFIKESEREFDVKIYRLQSFSLAYARSIYQELHNKYESKALQPNPDGWYENQRRLYVWFVICFMHLKLLESHRFLDNCDRYWKALSSTFWGKKIPFLKYQLLNIQKTKGRIVWREREDELLREAYKAHQQGEWNEIAKNFYFNSKGEFFKTPKQCRERWQNHLNDGIRKTEWTAEEDRSLFTFVKEYGPKWAKATQQLKGSRTEHMVKNRYKSQINKTMQDRQVNENQAIDIILKEISERDEVQKAENSKAQDSIEYVESQLYVSQQQKPGKVVPTSRTTRRKKQEKQEVPKEQKEQEVEMDGCKIGGYSLRKHNNNNHNNHPIIYSSMNDCDSFFKSQKSQSQSSVINNNRQIFINSGFFFNSHLQPNGQDPGTILLSRVQSQREALFFENDSIRSRNSSFKLNNESVSRFFNDNSIRR